LTRVGCELLVLAFKVVDWVAEIKAMLAEQSRSENTQGGTSSSPEGAPALDQ
jgi:hypothetical protein